MSNFNNQKQAMQSLTEKYVNKLTGIWEKIFHPEACRENLCKLIDHATSFYDELVNESLSRQSFIENEINELKKEAENLKRLLKTDVHLPTFQSHAVPLLIVQSELNKSLEDLREQLSVRKEQICELLLEQEMLCEELGEQPLALLADPLPTSEEIEDFVKHLQLLRDERVQRLNKIHSLRSDIKNFLQILDIKVNSEHENRLLNQRQIKMDKETLIDLDRMHSLYGLQVRELKETIERMRKKLHTLWDRLQSSPNTRNKFNMYNDYNQHTYDVIYSEIQRCESLKSQNIKLFVQQARSEISKMWEMTLKTELQKNRFSNFTSTCYTDDLLVLHEMELEDLNSFYESNKRIFELFGDRNVLWERMNALEAKASDPGRYKNRGGHLLKEEKERKTISTKLPKIEQQISELVMKYEEREHTPFLVYGVNIIDFMAAQWDQRRREKELLQSARKHAKPAASNSSTKTNTSTMRTPLSLKDASSVSSLRKTPSTISLLSNADPSPQKRKSSPKDRYTPMAKRSLMKTLNSPSVFHRPSTSKGVIQHSSHKPGKNSVSKRLDKSRSYSKPSFKKPKIIATTIRRSSGRYSGRQKKRLFVKTASTSTEIPKIVVENCQSDGYVTDYHDDTYDLFQNYIEPAAHSSGIQNVNQSTNSSHTKAMQNVIDEYTKLAKLPRPRIISCTPSPTHNNHNFPAASVTSERKSTPRNLPIIM